MEELNTFCREASNSPDHCQARVFRTYIIASLLGVGAGDSIEFTNHNGVKYRAMYFERAGLEDSH